jgi:predicted phosphodiesterase
MTNYTEQEIQLILDLREKQKTWLEIAEKYNEAFPNTPKTPNAVRKAFNRYNDINFRDDHLSASLKQVKTAKMRASLLAKQNEAILSEVMTQEEFLEEVKDILGKNSVKTHKAVQFPKKGKIERTIVAHMSDTHVGAIVSTEEVHGMNTFNLTNAARRFAGFFRDLGDYKIEHRDETDLVICLNGDMLAGVIHDQEWGVERMSTQFSALLSYLVQGITYVAQKYKSVRVYGTAGNHDRYIHKVNAGRQTSMKWDSFVTNVYTALSHILAAKHKNVEVFQSEAPYIVFDVQGHTFCLTHGDTVFNIKNPGKSLNMESIIAKLNKFNVELAKKESKTIDVLLIGHHHVATHQVLNDGTEVFVNGCLSGLDSFANGVGVFGSCPSQYILETTKKHPVGDIRNVKVSECDNDETLDEIIEPFKGKF